MGSDIPHIVARVANLLNSPSISVESGDLATNKFRMKEQFTKYNVATPNFLLARNIDDLNKALSFLVKDWL